MKNIKKFKNALDILSSEILIISAKSEEKKGIHPITFEDQHGNPITRLYDYVQNFYAGKIYNNNMNVSDFPNTLSAQKDNVATELVSTTMEALSDYQLANGVLESGKREKMLYTLGVLTK